MHPEKSPRATSAADSPIDPADTVSMRQGCRPDPGFPGRVQQAGHVRRARSDNRGGFFFDLAIPAGMRTRDSLYSNRPQKSRVDFDSGLLAGCAGLGDGSCRCRSASRCSRFYIAYLVLESRRVSSFHSPVSSCCAADNPEPLARETGLARQSTARMRARGSQRARPRVQRVDFRLAVGSVDASHSRCGDGWR